MPSQRTPGPLGLSSDPFPAPSGLWEEWPASPALPTGPASDATYKTGPVGLDYELPGESFDGNEEDESPAPIERFRYMEFQGEMVKVRCVPLWQNRMLGLLSASEDDEKAQEKLVREIKSAKPATRVGMVSVLVGQLKAEGKSNSPIAGRLAQIKLPQVEDEAGLPAVQRGRRTVNG